MINASSDSRRCWQGTTFIKVGMVLTTVLTATAVALIVLGHLKMNVLLLPGYSVAGGAGLVGLLTLFQYLCNKYIYSTFAMPVTPKPDVLLGSTLRQPVPDRSGFREIVVLPDFEVVLPPHHIKLNPNDLDRLGIADRSYIHAGDYVYTALAAPEIEEGCIGMSLLSKLGLKAYNQVPDEVLATGIITPFRGVAPIADQLTLAMNLSSPAREAFFYDPTYLQEYVVGKLQGHILTNHQLINVLPVERWSLGVRGINEGEYRTIGAETIINLIDTGTAAFFVPLNKTTPIEETTFTFELVCATQFEGDKRLQLFPKTDGDLSESDIQFYSSLGLDPLEIPEEPHIIPRELPDLNTLKPHILKQIQKTKTGIWSLPKTCGLVSTKTFWRTGEDFHFDVEGIRYAVHLADIQTKGQSVSCATVGIRSNTPKELVIKPISSTL